MLFRSLLFLLLTAWLFWPVPNAAKNDLAGVAIVAGQEEAAQQYALGLLYEEAGDWEALQKMPKNSSKVRLHNRCKLTGRPRGYMRTFGISRVTFREMASQGLIPGVTKASW